MFDVNTSIHNGLLCLTSKPQWWIMSNAYTLLIIYAIFWIMPVFMRFQLSWLDSSVRQIYSAIYGDLNPLYIFNLHGDLGPLYIFIIEILIYYILYMVMTTHITFCISCLFMAIVLLCIRDCYVYLQSYAEFDYCIILLDAWFFHLVLHQSTFGMDL